MLTASQPSRRRDPERPARAPRRAIPWHRPSDDHLDRPGALPAAHRAALRPALRRAAQPARTSEMDTMLERVRALDPDLVVLAGDLTTAGYEWEYEAAARWAEQIEFPKVVIPGNHDARNVGYVHFERLFGEPYSRFRDRVRPRARRAPAGDRLHGRRARLVRAGRERGPDRPRPLPVDRRAVRRAERHPHPRRPPPPRPDPGHGPRAEHRARRRRPAADADLARRRRRPLRAQARARTSGA